MTMSAADLLDDWLSRDRIKVGPRRSTGSSATRARAAWQPGTAYVLLHHEIGTVEEDEKGGGAIGGWGFVEGGMGAVSTNLAAAVAEYGGTVRRTDRREHPDRDEPAVGVVLESGDEIRAPIVVSNAHPR